MRPANDLKEYRDWKRREQNQRAIEILIAVAVVSVLTVALVLLSSVLW